MNYKESLTYLKEAENYGSVLGLTAMRELCLRLGNPQDVCPTLHVTGTNGKGSVMAMVYTTLVESGRYKVGRYTSPALFDYRERWEINGEMIPEETFGRLMTQVADTAEKMATEGHPHPTVFELETALAFLYFAQEGCDLALIEVGMGGDLDATNVIQRPILSVITNVSLDHQNFLGATLPEIAEKKAGIIKPGAPMLYGGAEVPAVTEVLRQRCEACGVPLRSVTPETVVIQEETLEGSDILYDGIAYHLALPGEFQVTNAMTAHNVLNLLEEQGYPVSTEERMRGFSHAVWQGRLTLLSHAPRILCDGAHNPDAAKRLASSLQRLLGDKKVLLILGVFQDKDYQEVARQLCPRAKAVFTIETPGNPRALPREELSEVAAAYCDQVWPMESVAAALKAARAMAGPEDVILACGSLSYLGILKDEVEKQKNRS